MYSTSKHSSKQRYLSPSYKKGGVKSKNKEDEFKLNLILNGNEDKEVEEKKKTSKRLSLQSNVNPLPQATKSHKKHNSVIDKEVTTVTEKTKQISLNQKYIKNIASVSQAGKGEDGFTKVNQDSLFVVPNEFKLPNFNIFCVISILFI